MEIINTILDISIPVFAIVGIGGCLVLLTKIRNDEKE